MKKFDFRLQSILRLRSFKEEILKTEMGEIVSQMNKVRDDIVRLNNEIDEAYQTQQHYLDDKTGGRIIHFFGYYVQGKRDHIKAKEQELEELGVKYERKGRELSKAMGDVKVMESIKDKEFTKYKRDYNKKEQENIEELLRMRQDLG